MSYPYTTLEVGNYVQVLITGATPGGVVSVVQNGGAPYTFPVAVDGSGNWSTSAQETGDYVGDYYQTWYVNGVALTPSDPYAQYFSYGPQLPSFSVSAGYFPSSPGVDIGVNACGGPQNVTAKWAWSPVSIYTNSSYGSSVINGAAQQWNVATNSIVSFRLSTENPPIEDILVSDGTLPTNIYGQTAPYSNACSQCYNLLDRCNGACLNSTSLYYANITLNTSLINSAAHGLGWDHTTEASAILGHEFGHTLQLDDVRIQYGVCSEVASVMTIIADLCAVYTPTSRDVTVVNGNYPNSPGYCVAGGNYCTAGVGCN